MESNCGCGGTCSDNKVPPADYDLPYDWGRRPTTAAPFPFNPHQYARLLIMRSKVEARILVPAS